MLATTDDDEPTHEGTYDCMREEVNARIPRPRPATNRSTRALPSSRRVAYDGPGSKGVSDDFEIAGRSIGRGRCLVVAEAGVNHNGDPGLAERLVDVAADAGVDLVKFQTFDPAALAAPGAAKAEYQERTTGKAGSQLEMLRKLALPAAALDSLKRRAHARGIGFLSTPFDAASADLLDALDVPAFKISSGDLTNTPLLRHVAEKRRPVFLSTGMATVGEVARAIEVVSASGAPKIALFHCVSNYPTEPGDSNLRAIGSMRTIFGLPTGWSDHTDGVDVSIAAVALGAELLEKHFTLDRTMPGPDHAASLEPHELVALVRSIRRIEAALGDGKKVPRAREQPVAQVARRSLHYGRALRAGERIERGDLVALRPGDGIAPDLAEWIEGRVVGRDVDAFEKVQRDDLRDG
jgi:N-acetylneuraminate synthase